MNRPPVRIIRGWVPGDFAAWVPRPRTIVVDRDATITVTLIAHELGHVRQFEERGVFFYLAYLVGLIVSRFRYEDHWMEDAAREAETNPGMRLWAQEVMTRNNAARR